MDIERSDASSVDRKWTLFGTFVPRSEIVFFCQVILIYIVTIISIVNLTRGVGESALWASLLGSALGNILPSPTIKKNKIKKE